MSVEKQFDAAFTLESDVPAAEHERAALTVSRIPEDVRTVLDVGCGTGIVTRRIAEKFDACGLELSSVGVARLEGMGIRCSKGSIDQIPFDDRSFDLVCANEVLEHLDDQIFAAARKEMARVARQYVLITVPNRERLAWIRQKCPRCKTLCVPWGHIRSFSVADLPRLIPDFDLLESREFGPGLVDDNRILSMLLRWPRRLHSPLRAGVRCPICAYVSQAQPSRRPGPIDLIANPGMTLGYLCDMTPIVLAPKRPRWILGLFRRSA